MNGEAWGIADAAAFVAAIDKDLIATTTENNERVRLGRLQRKEADYVAELLRDIRSDLEHAFGPMRLELGWERADPAVAWKDKVRWLRLELETRQARYPELVDRQRMTKADADLRIRVIGALYRLYWNQLFQWTPEPGPAADYLAELRAKKDRPSAEIIQIRSSAGAQVYRDLVRKHMALVDQEENGQGRLVA